MAAWQVITTQNGTWNSLSEMTLREQQHGDDAHGLLRVVAAMAERVQRGGDELQIAKDSRRPSAALARTNSHDTTSIKQQREDEAGQSATARWRPPVLSTPDPDNGHASRLGNAGTNQPADQRMRAARRNAAPTR